MPAAWPPQIVRWVSGRFGSTKATTSSLRTPRAVEEVRGGRDAREEGLVGPGRRPRVVLHAQEERQRRRLGVLPAPPARIIS